MAHQGFGFGAILRAVGLDQLRPQCHAAHRAQAQRLAGLRAAALREPVSMVGLDSAVLPSL
ncbi:hypothetical protein O1K_15751 [Xanthomonas fragariae LMG 25863]|nr:hypothetical protein O1K_15751 [Xanthomonas fragariae LMG 25863]